MNVPERLRETNRRNAVIRERADGHTAAIVVDFGPEAGDIAIDVVDDTAIVVVGDDHFEFELPDDAGDLSANNGVLTVEG